MFSFLQTRPSRAAAHRIEVIGHISGFTFCCLSFVSEAALAGRLLMLATAYLYHGLKIHGDKHRIWYDNQST